MVKCIYIMKNLSKKQEGFIKDYLDTGNGTQAVLKHYNVKGKNKENIAASIARENLTKPQIMEVIQAEAKDALARIVELSMTATNEAVKLSANKDILDRAGFKPTDKHDVSSKGEALYKAMPIVINMPKQ